MRGWAAKKSPTAEVAKPKLHGVVVLDQAIHEGEKILTRHANGPIWTPRLIGYLQALAASNRYQGVQAAAEAQGHRVNIGPQEGSRAIGGRIKFHGGSGGRFTLQVLHLDGGGWAVYRSWLKKSDRAEDPRRDTNKNNKLVGRIRLRPDRSATFTMKELLAQGGWTRGVEWARGLEKLFAVEPKLEVEDLKGPGKGAPTDENIEMVASRALKALKREYPNFDFDPKKVEKQAREVVMAAGWGSREHVNDLIRLTASAVEGFYTESLIAWMDAIVAAAAPKAPVRTQPEVRQKRVAPQPKAKVPAPPKKKLDPLTPVGLSWQIQKSLPQWKDFKQPAAWASALLDARPSLTISQLTVLARLENVAINPEGWARARFQGWRKQHGYGPLLRGNPKFSPDYPEHGFPANWQPQTLRGGAKFDPKAGYWPRRYKRETLKGWSFRLLDVDSSVSVDQLAEMLEPLGRFPPIADMAGRQITARRLIHRWRLARGMGTPIPDGAPADWLPPSLEKERGKTLLLRKHRGDRNRRKN